MLEGRRASELVDATSMIERGRKALWWPFTQHDDVQASDVTVVDSAYGDYFCISEVETTDGGEVSLRYPLMRSGKAILSLRRFTGVRYHTQIMCLLRDSPTEHEMSSLPTFASS